jgi:hypothetical protein
MACGGLTSTNRKYPQVAYSAMQSKLTAILHALGRYHDEERRG